MAPLNLMLGNGPAVALEFLQNPRDSRIFRAAD